VLWSEILRAQSTTKSAWICFPSAVGSWNLLFWRYALSKGFCRWWTSPVCITRVDPVDHVAVERGTELSVVWNGLEGVEGAEYQRVKTQFTGSRRKHCGWCLHVNMAFATRGKIVVPIVALFLWLEMAKQPCKKDVCSKFLDIYRQTYSHSKISCRPSRSSNLQRNKIMTWVTKTCTLTMQKECPIIFWTKLGL